MKWKLEFAVDSHPNNVQSLNMTRKRFNDDDLCS